ncbi:MULTISPECIES: PglZ domain-containing protein [Weeksella]|uniref:Response regulator receiver protein n=1 Tax=Weeksella virosa (strain ATCC 43766 / DSM 16922 / JCM 21250 / CCUG 30538 / CDC 9751 / IAM 14551 / NBRC 16016 / NCTC 11634 / CL345/78) TaxID=865938 RepID=F0NZ93_WEEVC|nr:MULTISPECIES: PglZ domain-containing protein [Weeksella]ADX67222.1 response regulator receiver protein [Weeksella virosa DSM 16922]MDK7375031.1 PglZ domain-containing protein [Weeksella virosa]MDK7675930.1 PglZ domain-containing protein [Weeksella virosa]OFM81681.1 two-component system response regulator [Weeksella sp. HMSC059D05]SUP53491.1 Sensory transduction protein regX3 [Weeksella virosa]
MAIKILWIDDEIDLLKPHALFLEKKGYEPTMINNATDALEVIEKENFDAVLIDENMPGLSGLEALPKIKDIRPLLPVIMVTKSEEEHIMEDAIGSHIADYLIKPVNPNQILLSLKKILESNKIISEKTIINYQQEFRDISMSIINARNFADWEDIYKKIVYWELELENISDQALIQIIENQKEEANAAFFKFIERNYEDWLYNAEDAPILSHQAFKEVVLPHLDPNEKVLLIMIDNLRYDQWKVIEPLFNRYYNSTQEDLYSSILPSATQYARNAFFAGLTPLDIQKKYPEYWLNDHEEGNKNSNEKEFLSDQLKRLGKGNLSMNYFKILNSDFERKISDDFNNFKNNNLNVIVYNFIDILSHAKTDNKIVSEMIRNDKTYRSITKHWFENSYLLEIVKKASTEGIKIIVTTDHGTIYVKEPTKVVGDKESSTNLRYKLGRQLQYDPKDVFVIDQPEKFFLPKVNISSKYIFAKENLFLTFPKNYNHFVNYYKDTYQHGGISLEEMIIPIAVLTPKKQ